MEGSRAVGQHGISSGWFGPICGPDRIQFAADWPFEDAVDAAARFRAMRLAPEVRRKLSHLNAERLWRIAA